MSSPTRRHFLKSAAALGAGSFLLPQLNMLHSSVIADEARHIAHLTPAEAAGEEGFWDVVRKAFSPKLDHINLENGYFLMSPDSVRDELFAHWTRINGRNTFYMRREMEAERDALEAKLAAFAGCAPSRMAITRNTTESLDTVIAGLDLAPGDEFLCTHMDYGSMIEAIQQQAKRHGIVMRQIELPLVTPRVQDFVDAFEAAITPRTKVMLVTHMINLNGQILPVKELIAMARRHGVEIILDSAHSFAQIDFRIEDLDPDYLGTSLHKWLFAPLGNGLLYMHPSKVSKVWPLFGDTGRAPDDMRKFEHQGTRPPALYLGIQAAIEFNEKIGMPRKEARLRYLKNYWAERAAQIKGVTLNTSLDDAQSCALANVAVKGLKPSELSERLLKDHNIWTVAIDGRQVNGVRVTPHLYTQLSDLDALVDALQVIAKG
jgi:selenocysteine lyase/cysteine desulfurase